ncbi:hypothetical protein NM688_g1443 [Phlebia brevispora]|uniref:Uncharacterized protein n=1 Tax=Phlebia brevispora TaxID=194682 RepID=A0ACC1TC54_9APHY|nr:hypothetical protein NM688_g1443 [Phlebia brevispora]
MQEEQDTCRICSAPAEPNQPLYYPCKCSGTIRYIHQDCLTTWLAHSKKKTCDVCKHPYSFTKVYAPNMPSRLPLLLLGRRLAQQSGYALIFALRAVLVGLLWLAFLPWATIWTWRMYFTMGNSTAWWISNRSRPQPHLSRPLNVTSTLNDTLSSASINSTSATSISFFSHPVVRAVSADIVAGQIIATVIVIAFVAIFLLREWISQNARPGVFDDGDAAPPEEAPAPAPVPQPPAPQAPPVRRVQDIWNFGELERAIPAPPVHPPPPVNGHPHVVATGVQVRHVQGAPDNRARRAGKERFVADSGSTHIVKRRHSWNGLEGKQDAAQRDYLPADEFLRQEKNALRVSGTNVSASTTPPKLSNRPPLFNTALFPSTGSASTSRFTESSGTTPLASPSLATYHAPEELEAGPSNYFNNVDDEYDEYNLYFRKPEDIPDHEHDDGAEASTSHSHDHAEGTPEHWAEMDEDDTQMPALAQWTDDDEVDEREEDDENAVEDLDGPLDMNEDREDADPFNLEARADDIQAADAMNDEDADVGMDDDMEGALEAIGLRGPIQTVLQNAALMIIVLDTTIGVGVWLPFTVGKSLALLSLDPRRLLYILHFPIRAIRLVTDPIVDTIMFLFMRLAVPPVIRLAKFALSWLYRMMFAVLGEAATTRGVRLTTNLYNRTLEVSQTLATQVSDMVAPPTEGSAPVAATWIDKLAADDSAFMRVAAPYFAPIGEATRVMWADLKEMWTKLAIGDGTPEKLFAIALGYVIAFVCIALYLNVLTVGSMKSAGRAMRSAVRQQLVVVKVATFIIVELVVFPLGCGIMLDVCSVSLFPQGSFRTRAEFLLYAPLTAAFYHWVIGTMFMYQFAVLLAGFRSCLRNGALWFIKDPQDQNFHPIRDILERPTLVHVRKLLISAVMYGLVVACGVGTVSGILRVFSKTIMPFRWKVREPLSEVPIDLIFLHMVMPYTLQHFRPKKIVKQGGLHVWRFLAHHLRLTSYLFGGRHAEEEYSLKRYTLHTLLATRLDDTEIVHDGTFRRVPNSDNVALAKDEPATVEVNEDGTPIDDKEARVMRILDEETDRAKRSIKDDYTIAYMPPYFRYRVILFIIALWMVCSAVLAVSLAAPILLGRYFFKLFVPHHVHDGYSFIAGFYLLWGCWLVSTSIDRMDKHRQRRGGGDEERAEFPLYIVKRSFVWFAQVSYLAVFLGIVIPTLISLVVELYLVMPIRRTVQPELQPRIRIVDMWAMGLMYTKVALRVQRLRPMGRISRGIEQIRRHGWTHPHPYVATKEVIAPIVVGLIGMITLPPAILWVIQRFLKFHASESILFLHIYPSIFTFTACVQGCIALATVIKTWAQGVRDKEFLVAMQLQNLEPQAKTLEADNAEPEDANLADEDDEE